MSPASLRDQFLPTRRGGPAFWRRVVRLPVALLDVLTLVLLTLPIILFLWAQALLSRRKRVTGRRLLVVDTSYTLHEIETRRLQFTVLYRDLQGFFDHVWSVHPLVGASPLEPHGGGLGKMSSHRINDRHTLLQARIGRYRWLAWLPRVNFLLSQAPALVQLRSLVRREGIGVVRAGNPFYLGLFGLVLARGNRIPLGLYIEANFDAHYRALHHTANPRLVPFRWMEVALQKWVCRRVDFAIGANEDNLQYAINNGLPRERSTVVRYGNLVDPLHFVDPSHRPSAHSLLSELGLQSGEFLVYIGRLEPVKHSDHAVRALAALAPEVPSAKLLIVGDGSLRVPIERLAQELGVRDKVVFAGNRVQPWLAAVLPHARVVLSPHTGRALVEAALGGRPIVAYDIDWQREMIHDGKTGALVPYLDFAAMGRRAAEFWLDPALAGATGRRGRETALEMMDPARLLARERDWYSRVLRGSIGKASAPSDAAGPSSSTHQGFVQEKERIP